MSAYGAFAGLYDRLMDDFDYPAWADYYFSLLSRANVAPKTLCDCACGTASLTIPFAARCPKVTGVDLSGEMLGVASDKARAAGRMIRFVQQDMCALALPRPVDALVCGCDGVNYLLTDERVRAFFERAHASIRSGGALAFDISSAYKLEQVLGNGFFGEERDDVAYMWWNSFDEEKRRVTMELTFFCREESGLYRRFTEKHVQKAHDPQRLKQMLSECGFGQIEIFGDRTYEAPRTDEKRIHFLAVRE